MIHRLNMLHSSDTAKWTTEMQGNKQSAMGKGFVNRQNGLAPLSIALHRWDSRHVK